MAGRQWGRAREIQRGVYLVCQVMPPPLSATGVQGAPGEEMGLFEAPAQGVNAVPPATAAPQPGSTTPINLPPAMPPNGRGRGAAGKGNGPPGRGGGRGAPGRGMNFNPQAHCPLPTTAPPGHLQMGNVWTEDNFAKVGIDFDRLCNYAYGSDQAEKDVAAQICPADSTLSRPATHDTVHGFRPQMDIVDGQRAWPAAGCKWCFHRPLPPPNTPQEELWMWGTGDGAHNPRRCRPCMRWAAEGGNADTDTLKAQACLRIQLPQQQQQRQ